LNKIGKPEAKIFEKTAIFKFS